MRRQRRGYYTSRDVIRKSKKMISESAEFMKGKRGKAAFQHPKAKSVLTDYINKRQSAPNAVPKKLSQRKIFEMQYSESLLKKGLKSNARSHKKRIAEMQKQIDEITKINKFLEGKIKESETNYREHKSNVDTKTKLLSKDLEEIQNRIKLVQ